MAKEHRQEIHRAWDIVVALCATVAALVLPLNLLPGFASPVPVSITAWIITGLYIADLIVRFRHGDAQQFRFSGGQTSGITWPGKVWSGLDFLAAIPVQLLATVSTLQLLPLVKLVRVGQFMRQWQRGQVRYAAVLRLILFFFWFLLAVHWISCGWIALRAQPDSIMHGNSYIDALYWTISTLTTVGYGDVIPVTSSQKLYAMGVMIFGVGVYGFIIGNIATILANIDPARRNYVQNMERLSAFMHYRNIPPPLQLRMREYYDYIWEKRLGFDESSILATMPPSIAIEVSLFLKRDIIERVPLFSGASDEFIREIALQMQPVVFTPGDYIVRRGERGSDMYFISRGMVDVFGADNTSILARLSDGDFFGEIALFMNQPRTATVRAVDYCDLYVLNKEMFMHVISHFPDISAQIEHQAQRRFNRTSNDEQVVQENGSGDNDTIGT